jgi:hypothetical protein
MWRNRIFPSLGEDSPAMEIARLPPLEAHPTTYVADEVTIVKGRFETPSPGKITLPSSIAARFNSIFFRIAGRSTP